MEGLFKMARVYDDDENLKPFCGYPCLNEFRKKSTYRLSEGECFGRGRRK
jgi:hypothetical protein